jgi:hypothetical protein
MNFNDDHVVKFRFFKEFSNYLCLGMELCVGGNLTDWIINQKAAAKTPDQAYEEQ